MKIILIGGIRFLYILITLIPIILGFLYGFGGGDGDDFLEKWLAPVQFKKGE